MAEMTISLRRDPDTGKQDIHISLRSDEDALPHEHEQLHRQVVEKLLGKGIISKPEDVGNITVEREEEKEVPQGPETTRPQDQREAEAQGN